MPIKTYGDDKEFVMEADVRLTFLLRVEAKSIDDAKRIARNNLQGRYPIGMTNNSGLVIDCSTEPDAKVREPAEAYHSPTNDYYRQFLGMSSDSQRCGVIQDPQ